MRSNEAFNFRNVSRELAWPRFRADWIPMTAKNLSDPPAPLRGLFIHRSHEAA